MFPSIHGGINGVHDEEEFGDFVFLSPSSSHAPPPFTKPASSFCQAAAADSDEGWTDFLTSTLESPSHQPYSSSSFSPPLDTFSGVPIRRTLPLDPPYFNGKGWEKPKGEIPLSVFGVEDTEEPEPLVHPGVSENGFASHSFSRQSSSRLPPTEKLSDLLEILYDQSGSGVEQDDDFDERSWEFKDAFSAYSRTKPTEEEGGDIFGMEMVASANGNGRQVDVNRIEDGCQDMDQFQRNQESISGDPFASHVELTGRSLGHSHSVTGNFLHEVLPNFGSGTLSTGTNGFKLEFPENAIRNGFTKKIQADQADVIYSPENNKGKEVYLNIWEIDHPNISAYANGKDNPYGHCEDHIERSTRTENMDDTPVAFTSIIENMYENAHGPHTILSQSPIKYVQDIDQHGRSSAYVSDDIEFDQFDWEFQNAVDTAEAETVASNESGQIFSSESNSYTLLDLYCRLKEESLFFIVHHLIVLKVPALPGTMPEVKIINKEIQEAYGNLQDIMAFEDACSGKKIAGLIDQLLNVTRTLNFKAVEHEYSLSERLLAAEKDLNAAIKLFVHSSSVLHILRLASKEQQIIYINAWSKLASACAQELQFGAKICTKSLNENISKQLLIKGNKYFIALGEVFRLLKILKATVKLYMPWLLYNLEDSSDLVTYLEKANEAWINSGLEETLRKISNNTDLDDRGLTKPLLESIKLIDKLIEPTYQDPVFFNMLGVCKFYLLPLDKLPDMNTAVWNGDCYMTKLANFWAHRISPDPPELPSITPS